MDRFRHRRLIATEVEKLRHGFGIAPVVACELEFTLQGSEDSPAMDAFWTALRAACERQGVAIYKTEKERGEGQQEVALAPAGAEEAARMVAQLKQAVAAVAGEHAMQADFSAKPHEQQPGNGLHVHIHLADASGKNVFYKKDAAMSDALRFALGGLLLWLPDSMPFFAPSAESYQRYVKSDNTPLTVSWGANNRTVALRLPDSMSDMKRIEHRVPCADCDPHEAIAVMLAAIHHGLSQRCEPGAQMYGDANLPQYAMPSFPHTLEEAVRRMEASPFFK